MGLLSVVFMQAALWNILFDANTFKWSFKIFIIDNRLCDVLAIKYIHDSYILRPLWSLVLIACMDRDDNYPQVILAAGLELPDE